MKISTYKGDFQNMADDKQQLKDIPDTKPTYLKLKSLYRNKAKCGARILLTREMLEKKAIPRNYSIRFKPPFTGFSPSFAARWDEAEVYWEMFDASLDNVRAPTFGR